MPEYRYAITVILRGPILTASSVTQAIGLDAPAARRISDNKLYLPGSLVRGRVREQTELLGLGVLRTLFGRQSGNRQDQGTDVAPLRSRIFFSDFIDAVLRPLDKRRTRINIGEDRGAVNEQMLAVLECPYEPGEHAAFTGSVRFFAAPSEHPTIITELTAAMRAISSFGSQRTVGFGRLMGVDIATMQPGISEPAPVLGGRTLGLVLSTSDLVCVARTQPSENLFEASQILPGNAIKGAIAATWLLSLGKPPGPVDLETDPQRRELGALFEQIRIRHARPVPAGRRERPLEHPLSLMRYDCGWKDTALAQEDPGEWSEVPSFQPDWKDSSPADSFPEFAQRSVQKELRVRTAIDRVHRRAQDNMLFAYEVLSPADQFEWLTYVDFPPKSENAARQLQSLLAAGIDAFGKTDAKLRCEFFAAEEPPETVKARDGCYVVVLQTPALLNDPRIYNDDLVKDYKSAWSDLSGGALELLQFKARQDLAGGYYQRHRFQSGQPYRPWLLTRAGSVFLLRPAKDQGAAAEKSVAKWLAEGLRIPEGAAGFYALDNTASDWKKCPYLRQNGYGEIAVNLDCHWDARLRTGRAPC
jgi:hypothetical protein